MREPPGLKFKENIPFSQIQAIDIPPESQHPSFCIEIRRPNNIKVFLYEFENAEHKSLWLNKIPGVKKSYANESCTINLCVYLLCNVQ